MTPTAVADRRVLVTGASGFLGSHLTRRLVREGAEVHALVRRAGGARLADVRPLVTEHEADVADSAAVACCLARARPEIVFHLAADTSSRRFAPSDWATVDRSITVNLRGTLHVLRAALECGSVRTFVRAGTLEEYGNGAVPHDETQREEPVSPYSASSVAATHFCQALQRHTDSAVVTLRPTLTYGPSQAADFFIPAVILACLRAEDFPMSSGAQCIDLLYVDDAVDAFVRAGCADSVHGAIVDIGNGEATRIVEVAEEVLALIGGPSQIRTGAVPERAMEPVHLVAATERAQRVLGWRPQIELREGLRRTIAWYRRHGDQVSA